MNQIEKSKETALRLEHEALGAKMVVFGGWLMPLQYESVMTEWAYNRQTCSLFDCSHMGEFHIWGDAKESGLDRLVTQSIVDMPVGACRYGAMLNTRGAVIDDLIVYRLQEREWMLVVNAANIEKDARHIQAHLTAQSKFSDESMALAKLDLQGPLSRDILCSLVDVRALSYYTFSSYELLGEKCIISRTGYTGELGYEIYYPWEKVKKLWQTILKNDKVKPTGLAVRDVLRIEMCYALYGHELNEEVPAVLSGLQPFMDLNKDFIGREATQAILKNGVTQGQGFIKSASRKSPREGHHLYNAEGKVIGRVTSGTFSPGSEAGIGIGLFQMPKPSLGDKIFFGDDKSKTPAELVKRVFYTKGSLKN